MLIGISFFGKEEMLIIREKIAWKRGRLLIFVIWDTTFVDADVTFDLFCKQIVSDHYVFTQIL